MLQPIDPRGNSIECYRKMPRSTYIRNMMSTNTPTGLVFVVVVAAVVVVLRVSLQ